MKKTLVLSLGFAGALMADVGPQQASNRLRIGRLAEEERESTPMEEMEAAQYRLEAAGMFGQALERDPAGTALEACVGHLAEQARAARPGELGG